MGKGPFVGFQVIEVLPTGDQRKVYEVGMTETSDSFSRNEIVYWVQCNTLNCTFFDHKNFVRGTESAEISAWVTSTLEAHTEDCPLEQPKGE